MAGKKADKEKQVWVETRMPSTGAVTHRQLLTGAAVEEAVEASKLPYSRRIKVLGEHCYVVIE